MKKYWAVARNTWDEMLTYRLNFTMYRMRNFLTFLTIYYLWLALLPEGTSLFGYTQSVILTYVLGTSFIQAFVISSRSYALGDDIIQGNLSNFLLKPFNYFYYWFAKDMGDKAMNVSFAIIELILLVFILRPPIFIQTDFLYILFFIVAIAIAIFLFFFCNILLGMIGFFSPEVWAPRFIFMVLIGFFSGGYFPLDILPRNVYLIFRILPFHYLTYFPLKIYLKQMPLIEITTGIASSIAWVLVLYVLVRYFWRRGLETYTAQGR
jgi:ABC-2 type transport system permease protein